ncbi:RNA-binding protein [Mucilaginibacter sp. CAU 1740]|uniref:RNA recognition motif domain-containing protein n=1 Tax=Mucilaginibacter sp. CAU 1740 TaxID=3140365 RepID=UPI00325A8C34
MIKLFIVGFPRDMEEVELVELFSAYGTVSSVRIITDKDSGISKGYGFLEMTDEAGANRAIDAMNGATIDEREISVRIAEQKHQPLARQQQQQFAKPKPAFNKVKPQGYNKPRFPRDNNNNSSRYEQQEAAAPVRAKRPRRQQP